MGHLDLTPPGHDRHRHSQRLRWILDSLAILAPDTVLMAPCPLSFLVAPDFCWDRRLVPILDPVRLGRRLDLFDLARQVATEREARLALRGGTLADGDGFDFWVLEADRLGGGGDIAVVCHDVATPEQLEAAAPTAEWVAGPAVAAPLRIAPVELSRLRR
jgi:hypothetical protein